MLGIVERLAGLRRRTAEQEEPKEKKLTLNYHCSQGFSRNLELVDPDGKGFAINKYGIAMLSEHNIWHKRNRTPQCGGLEVSKVQT